MRARSRTPCCRRTRSSPAPPATRGCDGPRLGEFRVEELMLPEELEDQLLDEAEEAARSGEGERRVDPETGEVIIPEAPEIDRSRRLAEFEDQIETRDVTPHDFGRIAAQTAKQVILQRIREAERDMMFEEYRDRVGELITGIVQQSDSRYTLVQLRERVEALLPKSEQVDGERYDHSQRIKAVIKEVSSSTRGPSIIVSRRDPELIKKLFELEVPEIADGLVEITNVAREPGYRSKIAVVSHADGVDPVGACVGPRGSRVRMVVSELRGEKIDIIPYNDEPARFVAKALIARARARGARRRREQAGDGDRARRPALAGDRPRGPERAARRAPDRLARRHPLGDRVRQGGDRRAATRRRRTSAAAAPRSSPTAAAARTPRCPARATAASTRTRRSTGKDTDVVAEAQAAAVERPASRAPLRRLRRRERRGRRCAASLPWRARSCPIRAAGCPGGAPGCIPTSDCWRGSRRPPRLPARPPSARDHPAGHRRLHSHMAKKRVHELAKQYDMPSAEVLKRLQAAGIEVKAAASAVDERRGRRRAHRQAEPKAAEQRRREAAPRPVARGRRAPAADRPRPSAPDGAPAATSAAAEQADGEARRRQQRRQRPTRYSLQGERAPGAGGGVRRVVIDSQASRRRARRRSRRPRRRPAAPRRRAAAAAAAAAPTRSRRRRTRSVLEARHDPHQLRLDRQGRRRVPRRAGARDDQEADGARRDGDAHADAVRRGDRGARRRVRQGDRDRPRRRRRRRRAGVRGRRRGPRRRARRSSRSWATSTTARRRCSTRSARPRSPRARPAASPSTSAPTRCTTATRRSRSSTRRATRRSPPCAPAAPRSPTSP